MKEQWDKRYASDQYLYGVEANKFFKQCLEELKIQGIILFPAEGEGRNAVYAGTKGYKVRAFDISSVAREKALKLADENQVRLDYYVGQIDELDIQDELFGAVVLTSVHVPAPKRASFHKELIKKLKPGGYIILEGFSKDNLELREKNPEIGGPPNRDMLFSKEDIQSDFDGLEVILLEQTLVELNEGVLHNGEASVIRYIGRKK
jgi:SAM-dependent methyltransferase